MSKPRENQISKHIRLSEYILKALEEEAIEKGFSLNEWMKVILVEKASEYISRRDSVREAISQILARYKLIPRRTREYKDDKDITELIDSLKVP